MPKSNKMCYDYYKVIDKYKSCFGQRKEFRMKRKWIFCICLYLCLFAFGGCGAQIPDMTDEERETISEYAANLLLKYDTSQPSRLVDITEEAVEATPEPTQTPEPVETSKPEETAEPEVTDEPLETIAPQETQVPEVYDSLEDTLMLPQDVTLLYNKYEAVRSFEDETDGYQTLEAEDGKLLLIFRFTLLNSSNATQSVDMLQDNIVYKVIIDDTTINGMITMVGNDLTTYIGSLQADESMEMVMFAEAEEELLQNVQSIRIEFLRQEMVAKIIIK